MGAMFASMPAPEGSMMLMIIGSFMGHVIFGIVTALFLSNASKIQYRMNKEH